VRTASHAGAELVRRFFAPHLATSVDGPARYSLRIAPDTARGPRSLHTLYEGSCLLFSTPHCGEVLQALATAISGLVRRQLVSGWDAEAVSLLTPSRGLVLLPAALRKDVARWRRRLASRGLVALQNPTVGLRSGQLPNAFVPGLDVETVPTVLEPVLAAGRSEADVRRGNLDGPFPIHLWLVPVEGDLAGPIPPVEAVPLLLQTLVRGAKAPRTSSALAMCGEIARTVPLLRAGNGSPRDLLDAILDRVT
jgi:hypothetical protein